MTDPRDLIARAGLSQSGAARFLGRDVRTVQRWCAPPGAPGFSPMPHWAAVMLRIRADRVERSYPRRHDSAAD
jgi:hypothetical protein